jgi:predicted phosphoribosyltransferase
MTQKTFRDRRHAGQALTGKLVEFQDMQDAVVLALPRGGVPVGYEVALALHLPLDVFIVRKLGVPGQEELGMGAIASGGSQIINPQIVKWSGISSQQLDEVIAKESAELQRREELYRIGRAPVDLGQKLILLVDDGLATGSTMMAAIRALRQSRPEKLSWLFLSRQSTCVVNSLITLTE